jgi:hypothetical protein
VLCTKTNSTAMPRTASSWGIFFVLVVDSRILSKSPRRTVEFGSVIGAFSPVQKLSRVMACWASHRLGHLKLWFVGILAIDQGARLGALAIQRLAVHRLCGAGLHLALFVAPGLKLCQSFLYLSQLQL